jgi:serine/threonine protein kinase
LLIFNQGNVKPLFKVNEPPQTNKKRDEKLILDQHFSNPLKVGSGSYGQVYTAEDNKSKEKVAIKFIYVPIDSIDEVIKELYILGAVARKIQIIALFLVAIGLGFAAVCMCLIAYLSWNILKSLLNCSFIDICYRYWFACIQAIFLLVVQLSDHGHPDIEEQGEIEIETQDTQDTATPVEHSTEGTEGTEVQLSYHQLDNYKNRDQEHLCAICRSVFKSADVVVFMGCCHVFHSQCREQLDQHNLT